MIRICVSGLGIDERIPGLCFVLLIWHEAKKGKRELVFVVDEYVKERERIIR